jgi:esterase/lipase superfamily enzyme
MSACIPACAPLPALAPQPADPPLKADVNAEPVPVYYATSRAIVAPTAREGRFGNSTGSGVSYGRTVVSIPLKREPGSIPRPGAIYSVFFEANPARHFLIAGHIRYSDRATFLNRLRSNVTATAAGGRKQAMIFVHGFNVGFDDAAFRTAQIKRDTGFKGTAMFFSWPSAKRMSLAGYRNDSSRIIESQVLLKNFFAQVVEATGADDVFIIAHSMGTQGTTGALKDLAVERPQTAGKIRALILAAPDINKRVFLDQLAPALGRRIRNITVYASGRDRALLLSRTLSNAARLGETDSGIAVGRDFTSIDASGVDMSVLGHSGYGDSPPLIRDIGSIMSGSGPDTRTWLDRRNASPRPYYRFRVVQP